jgi:hypothetical protein
VSESAQAVPLAVAKAWTLRFRVEIALFLGLFLALASLSSFRFFRQSEAPHFVYQAQAWLEGHQHVDPQLLPNLEDWACVREVAGAKTRCEGRPLLTDRWYSSFPPFPAMVMLPWVAIHGYQFNDTSFGVIIGALAMLAFYVLLKLLFPKRSTSDNIWLTLLLCFGSVFALVAIRGEVWFLAETLGVLFTCLYLFNAAGARRPVLAGAFWSMAVVTRAPLLFTGLFFILEALAPEAGSRWQQLSRWPSVAKRTLLLRFAAGAAPLGLLSAWLNMSRFGSVSEFGHRFLYNNRVNPDIDSYGLFHPHYLLRNVEAAFLRLPVWAGGRLTYDPWGLTLALTLPWLALAFSPFQQRRRIALCVGSLSSLILVSLLFPPLPAPNGEPPIGFRSALAFLAVGLIIAVLCWAALRWSQEPDTPRLVVPLLWALVACAVPGLLYQNTGYAQFGFRFSLDYTPYVFLLVACAGWNMRHRLLVGISFLAVLVNFWGVIAFRGYTEMVRGWM